MKKVLILGFFAFSLGVAGYLIAASGSIATWTGGGARNNTIEFEILAPTVGTAADFVPGTDNTNSLGTTALAWDDVQTNDFTAVGTTTLGPQTNVTSMTISGLFAILQDAAPNANLTPTTTGQLVFDTGSGDVCMSTSATANSWVLIATPTISCP